MKIEDLEYEATRLNKDAGKLVRLAAIGGNLRCILMDQEDSWKMIKSRSKENSPEGDAFKTRLARRSYVMSRLYYIMHLFNLLKSAANKSEKGLADLKIAAGDLAYVERALRSIGADDELIHLFISFCKDIID